VSLDLSGTLITQDIIESFSSTLRLNLELISFSHSRVASTKQFPIQGMFYHAFQPQAIQSLDFPSLRRLNLDGNAVCYDGSLLKLKGACFFIY
jgi:hypothetical protein